MQILINISEVAYNHIKSLKYPTAFEKSIQNGVVLPKGHGRLIDVDKLKDKRWDARTRIGYITVIEAVEINNAPTVIEADKE